MNQKSWNISIKFELTTIEVDSTAAASFARHRISSRSEKHIEIRSHHILEMIELNIICIEQVPSALQVADFLTEISLRRSLLSMIEKAHLKLKQFCFWQNTSCCLYFSYSFEWCSFYNYDFRGWVLDMSSILGDAVVCKISIIHIYEAPLTFFDRL